MLTRFPQVFVDEHDKRNFYDVYDIKFHHFV